MSKILLPQDKETLLGIGLFIGVMLLFLINVTVVTLSLIQVYGTSKKPPLAKGIDASTLSEAVKVLQLVKN